MTCRQSVQRLLQEGLIKKCPVDHKAIRNLRSRASVDLRTAKRNLDEDPDCAYAYAYNAMLRCGLALMFSEGFRPEIKDKHLTIVEFARSALGDQFKLIIDNYDVMRRKRHRFVYEPDIPCSREEAEQAIKMATKFVRIVGALVRKHGPQTPLDLGK